MPEIRDQFTTLGRLSRGIHGLLEEVISGRAPIEQVLESLKEVTKNDSAVPDAELGKLARASHAVYMQLHRGEITVEQALAAYRNIGAGSASSVSAPAASDKPFTMAGPYAVTVDYRLGLRRLAKWSQIEPGPGWKIEEMPCEGEGVVERSVLVVHPADQSKTNEEITYDLTHLGYPPASVEFLVAYAAMHPPTLVVKRMIIAAGTKNVVGNFPMLYLPASGAGHYGTTAPFGVPPESRYYLVFAKATE